MPRGPPPQGPHCASPASPGSGRLLDPWQGHSRACRQARDGAWWSCHCPLWGTCWRWGACCASNKNTARPEAVNKSMSTHDRTASHLPVTDLPSAPTPGRVKQRKQRGYTIGTPVNNKLPGHDHLRHNFLASTRVSTCHAKRKLEGRVAKGLGHLHGHANGGTVTSTCNIGTPTPRLLSWHTPVAPCGECSPAVLALLCGFHRAGKMQTFAGASASPPTAVRCHHTPGVT